MIYVQRESHHNLIQAFDLIYSNPYFERISYAIFLTEKAKDFLRSGLGFSGDPILNLISRCVGKHHLHVRDFM